MNITKQIWDADQANHAELRRILDTPIMLSAMALARQEARPQVLQLTADSLIQGNALENARVFGFNQALDYLEKLTHRVVRKELKQEDAFTHAAIKKLREAGLEPPEESPQPQPNQNQ